VYTDMENRAQIRRRVLVGDLSRRAACRAYGIHWKTPRKVLTHAGPPGYRRATPKRPAILEPPLPVVHQPLEDDRKAPREQRHTARRLFERLRDEHGYTGGLTIVKDAVRARRRRHAEVFVPLAHPPGEARVDSGEAEVVLDGRPTEVASFVLTLPYSDALPVRAFPRECTEASLEGHVRAFAFLGGVPRRISRDNSRIAVARITGSRDRRVTDASLMLKSHHPFESHFCLVRRPNEKGHVETLVGHARRNFLVPVPALQGGLGGLNARLEADRHADLSRRPRGKPATRAELLAEERAAPPPLPAEAFEAARVEPTSADAPSLVRFDTNDYSVPTEFAHRPVTAIGTVDVARIAVGDRVVAVHRRSRGREGTFDDPVHYLALLGREPGAPDFAAPPAGRGLPVCFGALRRRPEAEFGGPGTRQFIEVLRLLERASLPELTGAVERAPEPGTADADAVRLILEHRRERPAGLFSPDGRPHLKLVGVPAPDLSADAGRTAEVRP
jgi:transposase